mgnify:CR=1 FL=1
MRFIFNGETFISEDNAFEIEYTRKHIVEN